MNSLSYFCVSDFRTYGSLENTTAGGTPYPHSSFGARSRPSPSRARLVSPYFHGPFRIYIIGSHSYLSLLIILI